MQHRKTLMLVLTALFAALTAIGAFFKIPFALAAISLQFLFTAMAGILLGAAPVSYQTGGGWVSAAMDSDEAQSFTGALIALFPENFCAVSAAYEPEEIVIRFSLEESAPHYVDVNSGPVPDAKEMEISSIEINRGGILFLLVQGAALGKV